MPVQRLLDLAFGSAGKFWVGSMFPFSFQAPFPSSPSEFTRKPILDINVSPVKGVTLHCAHFRWVATGEVEVACAIGNHALLVHTL